MKHTCELVTSQTYGMIEFFSKSSHTKDKEIQISKDEVLDSVIGVSDAICNRHSDTTNANNWPLINGNPGTGRHEVEIFCLGINSTCKN